ncbi:MAG: hypothetical protein PHI47_03250 [Sulfuricurvum sp.]|uniref:hypothetical protein n=1 Tax=Sulfuricurvum sp. TaxID=2025608 RepID=UPI002621B795|nr:hypothetical protein [Sulfuricurvum sp.]MDD5159044.1 hypothetical protein [Sulfuricurvum sp.]
MKFIASKKLSDNVTLRAVILWMLITLMLAMGLSLSAKRIDFGLTPDAWIATVMGSEAEFVDPLLFSDLLLGIHTDLFGLIITFILIASLYVRTSRTTSTKITLFAILLITLLSYPLGLLTSSVFGAIAVVIGLSSFILFHSIIIMMAMDLLIALIRRRL